jgi:hypothetical protein
MLLAVWAEACIGEGNGSTVNRGAAERRRTAQALYGIDAGDGEIRAERP